VPLKLKVTVLALVTDPLAAIGLGAPLRFSVIPAVPKLMVLVFALIALRFHTLAGGVVVPLHWELALREMFAAFVPAKLMVPLLAKLPPSVKVLPALVPSSVPPALIVRTLIEVLPDIVTVTPLQMNAVSPAVGALAPGAPVQLLLFAQTAVLDQSPLAMAERVTAAAAASRANEPTRQSRVTRPNVRRTAAADVMGTERIPA
jgi:hypothetical protein